MCCQAGKTRAQGALRVLVGVRDLRISLVLFLVFFTMLVDAVVGQMPEEVFIIIFFRNFIRLGAEARHPFGADKGLYLGDASD